MLKTPLKCYAKVKSDEVDIVDAVGQVIATTRNRLVAEVICKATNEKAPTTRAVPDRVLALGSN